ncbi:1-acyl-sn-glycerol-3-phosphate acyltransferase [Anaerocolumna cellulosilytica]|uniref:1-acyl-sn-glycerol-3-phosphate acyltransferase n=1 Tax=Anaerocolumna cellulosilytica TaxID=433286 RepID=A0A6S6QX73_9FIRM|nr:lysophospholipid acyltransferase family protein [Anaerocolumna cellulosilytica]MBB5196173.1 1-acyl-sn-glycerol-3-phosphate acyltransferase [Anaerocolumna cellulosilytica]BCJ92507.1 1-acyl-sn-glycerol-3-phosphate acyltransferase [Anaerocolumna cellulosilytica]
MKTILVGLFLLIFFIISIPLFLIETIIGKINPHMKVKSSQAIVVGAFKIILFICGIRKTVIGLENVPKDKAVLYVANHRSYFDILIGYTTVPNLTGFVAKKEMSKLPFISIWMRYLNCLFLDRDNVREGLKTILQGIELIKQGYSVFISPEGTRNQGKEMLPFKEGSLKMAEKSGCPIIPVSINNTDTIFETHLPWIRKAHVVIEYGKPVYPDELDKETRKFIGSHIQNIIKETLEKNEPLV